MFGEIFNTALAHRTESEVRILGTYSRSTKTINSSKLFQILGVLAVLLLAGSYLPVFLQSYNIGWIDFIQYWTSAKVFADGGNPYDPAVLASHQAAILGKNFAQPTLLWNPPLVFPFIFWLPEIEFYYSRALWFLLSITIFAWAIRTLCDGSAFGFSQRTPSKFTFILILCYLPFVSTISFGQISALLLLGVLGAILGIQRRRFALSGALLSLTLIKPHLFLGLYFLLLIRLYRTAERRLLLGFACSACVLAIGTWIYQPHIFTWYLAAFDRPPQEWFTATLATWIRVLAPQLPEYYRFAFLPFLLIIPALVKGKDLLTAILLTLPLSFCCAPYGWQYDQVALFPSLLYLAHILDRDTSSTHWLSRAALLAGSGLFFLAYQHYSAFYPPILLLCMIGAISKMAPTRSLPGALSA